MSTETKKATVIFGMQWGDEGKGKIVDYFAENASVVARFFGGANAGHTIQTPEGLFKLHLVPSGVCHENVKNLLCAGVAVDPDLLIDEISELKKRLGRLPFIGVSPRAPLVLPWHKELDRAREEHRGAGKLGTTGRGIGPAYEDWVRRTGLRFGDLFSDKCAEKIVAAVAAHNEIFTFLYGRNGACAAEIIKRVKKWKEQFRPFYLNTGEAILEALISGHEVILEGAQGYMLDLVCGGYPFVTSSFTTASGACVGAELPPDMIGEVIGVAKAYTTRVGSGPFPTELKPETVVGKHLSEVGREVGTTTGRKRRCGWLDLVPLRTAVRYGGAKSIALTKLDVLSGLKLIRVCVSYRIGEKHFVYNPEPPHDLSEAVPEYIEFEGWREDISKIRDWNDLPLAARVYVLGIENWTNALVRWVSVGPEREAMISVPS